MRVKAQPSPAPQKMTPEEIQARAAQIQSLAIAGLAQSLSPLASDEDRHRAARSALAAGTFDELSNALDNAAWSGSIERFGRGNHGAILKDAAFVGAPNSILKKLGAGASEAELSSAALRAALLGNAEAAIDLIALGASVNAKEPDGRTMLHHCAAHIKPGHLSLMAFLLAEGSSAGEREEFFGATPLAWGCYSKNPDAVKLLVGSGGLDVFDARGRTALAHCSAHDGSAECAKILLARGAHLHAKPEEHLPCAFEIAILEGSPAALAMVPWVDFSKRATNGLTWLELAAQERGYILPQIRDSLVANLGPAHHAANDRDALLKLLADGSPATTKVRKQTL